MTNEWLQYVVMHPLTRVRVAVRGRIDPITTLLTISERNAITFCNS